jgi:hypothetical protein
MWALSASLGTLDSGQSTPPTGLSAAMSSSQCRATLDIKARSLDTLAPSCTHFDTLALSCAHLRYLYTPLHLFQAPCTVDSLVSLINST